MDIQKFRDYCLNKEATTESLPFDENVLVFKVLGKIYALTPIDSWGKTQATVNLKATPEYSEELRSIYTSIRPGFHMNKKHWNTLYIDEGGINDKLIFKLVDHSYNMVVKGLPKKERLLLRSQ